MKPPKHWRPRTPSSTCETWDTHGIPCGAPSTRAYPAMGDGYHAMCATHAQKHLAYCVTIAAAQRGEVPPSKARPAEGEPK